tara:strand:+ start:177 stop:656 length:480 start_codon:yes stop_codon:yes gene_type:complete
MAQTEATDLKAVNEKLQAAKDAQKENNAALASFRKKNKLKKGAEPADEKLSKELKKLEAASQKGKELVESLTDEVKKLTPRKDRVTKYAYPEDCTTSADKKKFRAKMRAEERKAKKGEDSPAAKPKPSGKTSSKRKPSTKKVRVKLTASSKAGGVADED